MTDLGFSVKIAKVMRMEQFLQQTLLYDFYGELLTDKQRECCDLHFNEDFSLGEIAEQLGISRQAVWDNIRRGESSLEEIERKTGLIRRFSGNREKLDRLAGLFEKLKTLTSGEARALAGEGAEYVESMKLDTEV